MKKCLLLLAAALLTAGASAQTAETLKVSMPQTPYKAKSSSNAPALVTFTQGGGSYNFISNAISTETYSGFKFEYSDLSSTDNLQFVVGVGENTVTVPFTETSGTIEFDFAANGISGWPYTISVQSKENVTGSITINSASLIKTGGETEAATDYTGWGYTLKQDVTGITFTGQYGYALVKTTSDEACTYDPAEDPKGEYSYTLELASAAPCTIGFEADYYDEADGVDKGKIFGYINKGQTKTTITINKEKCGGNAISNIYIKAYDANDDGENYKNPYTIEIKGVTRSYTTNKTSDEFKYAYDFPMQGDYVILKEDLEKFDDTDLAIFTYSCDWTGSASYNTWNVAGLKNPEVAKENDCFIMMPCNTDTPSSYTFSTTIGAIKQGVGHHTPDAKDAEEWDGVRWESWGTMWTPPVTTTKGTFKVYSDKIVKFDDETSLKPIDSAEVISSEYFSLSGVKNAKAQKGVNIVRQKLSDGSVRTLKTVVK